LAREQQDETPAQVTIVLKLDSPGDAQRLRSFFSEAGYSEENLHKRLGHAELPSLRLRNVPRLLDRTREHDCLNTLLRWFWIGVPSEAAAVEGMLPAWFVDLALQCGLLRRESGRLVPEVLLVPMEGLLVAADRTAKIEAADPDFVLWPNPTTRLLSRFMIRRHSRATLDLGTGTGIIALSAAQHSDKVVATDLNPRAVAFAAFNARLNAVDNVESLFGDGYEPVAGRRFDLIVSNPPFFITPSTHYLFCDNPMELDGLCRRLVREAPAHLEEDGYFQMLCEWAQVTGQPWRERVAEWFQGTGCDAWVLKGHTDDPSEYAQERIRETSATTDRDAELYDQYMAYYQQRKVEAIHKGLIAVRRRSGRNWVLIDEIERGPQEPFGDAVLLGFSARDFLESHASDDQMLAAKPRLSPHARLEQVFQQGEDGWQRNSLTLRLVKGFPSSLGVQPLVAEFLGSCNGSHSLGQIIDELTAKVNAPPEQVRTECLKVIRSLVERGFVLC
jgi:hypothetical protein